MSPKKILIIGSGITGALCSLNLSKALPLANVIIWDKARGAGGRMSTTRTDNGHRADLGAQYITTSTENLERFDNEYQPLLKKGILSKLTAPVDGMKPFASDVVHFVAPDGMASVVKSILSDTPVFYNRRVNSILVEGGKYKITAEDGSCEDNCDVVISTIPVPQFLTLPGINSILDETNQKKLEQVEYSTRYVLIWYYDHSGGPNPGWASKYLNDDVFRFVSVDNVKRNKHDEPVTVVFHTSIQYGERNKLKTRDELEDELNTNAKRLFPDWEQPRGTKCHKWLYSQVVKAFPGNDGYLVLTEEPTFVLAGDAFTESNFNGCIDSARAVVQKICNNS